MMMNEEITLLTNRIIDDPSDTIPNDLLRELTDRLAESEVYVPVEDDMIALYSWGPRTYIPISCDLDDFKKAFKDDISLKEACVELGFLTAEKFDEVFHPEEMV